jgi:DNA-binding transcriptional LysR family regulator
MAQSVSIDFTRLKYFVAVAEELHFKRAADRLHITPPPLSKQIKLLERELGGELFARSYHDVRLTPLGAALVEPAHRILDMVTELRATASKIAGSAGPLRVGATAFAPSDFLYAFEDAVYQLTAAPTQFSIPGSAAEVAAHLVAGHLDLGLIHLPCPESRVDFRVISRYRSGIAVRNDDPLAAREVITIDDLRDREVAVDIARANPLAMATLTRRLNSSGVARVVEAAGSRASEVELAAQVRSRRLVLLIAYAPDSILGRVFSPPQFKLIPIDDQRWKPGQLALAWSRDRPEQHPALRAAIDELTETFDAA